MTKNVMTTPFLEKYFWESVEVLLRRWLYRLAAVAKKFYQSDCGDLGNLYPFVVAVLEGFSLARILGVCVRFVFIMGSGCGTCREAEFALK